MTRTTTEIEFERGGTPLFAVERGRGRPIVFVHGGLSDHRGALLQTEGLVDAFRVITPDLRGAGRSVFAGPLRWDDWADDIAALVDHLGLRSPVIGGISAGSGVALRFALRHPRKAAGLVILAPAYAGADQGQNAAQRAAFERMSAAARRALHEGIDALLPLFDSLPVPIRERARTMARQFDPASVVATTTLLSSGDQPFSAATELAAVDIPVLIVPGTDPEHPAAVAQRYAEHLPRAHLAAPSAELGDLVAAFVRDQLAPQ